MRGPQEKENRKKKSWRHIFIIGNSMLKHVNGPGISKNDEVQVKTHSGATTDDIIDYTKPTICLIRDIVIAHSGTNDLTKDVNTMNRVRKVVAAVKEIDTHGKIKLGFSGIVARGDIKKILLVLTIGLKSIVKEMSSFLSIIAILMQVA